MKCRKSADDPIYLLMQEQITLIALLVVPAGVVVGAALVVQAGAPAETAVCGGSAAGSGGGSAAGGGGRSEASGGGGVKGRGVGG